MLPDNMYEYRCETPTAKVVGTCIMCNNDIHQGEKHYAFPDLVCEECLDEYTNEFKVEE